MHYLLATKKTFTLVAISKQFIYSSCYEVFWIQVRIKVCFFGAHQMRVGCSVWVHKGKLQTGYKLETKVVWTKCCSVIGQTVRRVKRQSPCNSYPPNKRRLISSWPVYQQTFAHGTCGRMVKLHTLNNLIIYAFPKKPTAVRRRYYRQQQALTRRRLTEGIYVCDDSMFVPCRSLW